MSVIIDDYKQMQEMVIDFFKKLFSARVNWITPLLMRSLIF